RGVVRAEGVHREAARAQPAGDPLEQLAEPLAGHVVEDVEGADGVEGSSGQLEPEEVGVDELRVRDVLPRTADLLCGYVDTGYTESPRELGRVGQPGPAAELEHGGAVRQPRGQIGRPLAARIALDLVAPLREAVGN